MGMNVIRHPAEVFCDDFTAFRSFENGAQPEVAVVSVCGFVFHCIVRPQEPKKAAKATEILIEVKLVDESVIKLSLLEDVFGLDAGETETVAWLVRHHLLLSHTAFRRDLADPKTIDDFVRTVQSPERLRLLLIRMGLIHWTENKFLQVI